MDSNLIWDTSLITQTLSPDRHRPKSTNHRGEQICWFCFKNDIGDIHNLRWQDEGVGGLPKVNEMSTEGVGGSYNVNVDIKLA